MDIPNKSLMAKHFEKLISVLVHTYVTIDKNAFYLEQTLESYMLKWKRISRDFISVEVGQEYGGEPFYWTTFYYYKGLIIDSGCPHAAEESAAFLEKMGLDLDAILLTHFHEDHSGGAYLFKERFGIEVFAPEESLQILENPQEIPAYRQMVWGQPNSVRAKPLKERMKFGNMIVITVKTPGHSFDHVSFLVETKLFMGDLVANPNPVIIMKQEDYTSLIESLKLISNLDFETAYGGHGVWDKSSVRKTLNNILKLRRDIETLHRQGLSSQQIVERVFSNVPEKVVAMERLSEFEWSRRNLVESLLGLMHDNNQS